MQKVIDLQAFRKVHQPETLVPRDETKDPVDDDLIFDTDEEEEEDDDDDDDDGGDGDGEGEDLGGFVVADDEVDDGVSALEAASRIKRVKKPQKKTTAKKDPKNKGKDKVKSPPRTLAEVRKDAMRNAKSKKQCMCFFHMFFFGGGGSLFATMNAYTH